jgi:hypothetical protein
MIWGTLLFYYITSSLYYSDQILQLNHVHNILTISHKGKKNGLPL